MKAFLSHSSADKDFYIRIVAETIGTSHCEYDEYTFEAGMTPLEEIIRGLDASQLFVIFLSDAALNSKWVRLELSEAVLRLHSGQMRRIFPIIIDNSINHYDPRIPAWMKENYNLRYISRPVIAARRIKQRLRELSWDSHPELKARSTIFAGRNDQLKQFETRIDNFDLPQPRLAIASGLPGIGRSTFLTHACRKANIVPLSYVPNLLSMGRDDSIEDFIVKIYDLGFSSDTSYTESLLTRSIDSKIETVRNLFEDLQRAKELLFVRDDGCLIDYKGDLAPWLESVVNNLPLNDTLTICIASKYRLGTTPRYRNSRLLHMEIPELSMTERKGLLKRYLELLQVSLSASDFQFFSEQLYGLPEQVLFCADFIKEIGPEQARRKAHEITEFSSERAGMMIRELADDTVAKALIALLSEFECISLEFLFDLVDESQYAPALMRLEAHSLCDYIGAEKDFVRLNDVVRDFVLRNQVDFKHDCSNKIKKHVEAFLADEDKRARDSSDVTYSLKAALMDNPRQVDASLLVPSLFLKSMKDLYYKKRNLDTVIVLARLALEKEAFMTPRVVEDVRYFLCLALAKKKDKEVLTEVQKVHGPEHAFIRGYYYRQCGRQAEAIEMFSSLLSKPYIAARAQRELVQVYLAVEEFDKALAMAKDNYDANPTNLFHIQAYFNCLINGSTAAEHYDVLRRLLAQMLNIPSELAKEMGMIAEAKIEAQCHNRKDDALRKIDDAIASFPDSHYPLLTKIDIGITFRDLKCLEDALLTWQNRGRRGSGSQRAVDRAQAFAEALKGHRTRAIHIIEKASSKFPPESQAKIKDQIEQYAGLHDRGN